MRQKYIRRYNIFNIKDMYLFELTEQWCRERNIEFYRIGLSVSFILEIYMTEKEANELQEFLNNN